MKPRLAFLCVGLAACEAASVEDPVARGARALARLQGEEGSWRSAIYPDMKQGPALTALSVVTLATIRREEASARRGLDWLLRHTHPQGQVGNEYPNFTTAMTLRAVLQLKPEGWKSWADRMAAWLEASQVSEPGEPGFGGWGLGGLGSGQKETIRLDVSTARHMIEALAAAGRLAGAARAARGFILACRNPEDGGFCYSRANPHQNKAGEGPSKTGFRSYGTATADGLIALRWIAPDAIEEIGAARRWLEARWTVESCPGFDPGASPDWGKGLLYYFFYAASEAMAESSADWKEPLRRRLAALQAPDGSWSNPSALMKENEPVVATCFALQALHRAR